MNRGKKHSSRASGSPLKSCGPDRTTAADLVRSLEEKNEQLAALNRRLNVEASERQRIETALRESEKLLQTIVDSEPECVKMLAADGSLLLMNKAGLEMIEADSLEQVRGRCVYPLVNPEYRKAFERVTRNVFSGKSGILEFEMTGLHGRRLWLETHAVPLRSEHGEIIALLGITRDITERKRTEMRLLQESSLHQSMEALSRNLLQAESIQDIADLVLDESLRISESKYGYVGFIDAGSGALISPTLTRDIWDQCAVLDKTVIFEKFTGLWGWVLINKRSLLTNDPSSDPRSSGIPAGHIPIRRLISVPALIGDELIGQISVANAMRDYTDWDLRALERLAVIYALGIRRKQAEEALREEESRFRTLFEGSPDAIFLADVKTGRILDANPAASALTLAPRDRIIGRHHSDLHPAGMRAFSREAFSRSVAQTHGGRKASPVETAILRNDGTEVPVEVLAQVITLQGRQVLYGVFRNITQRKRTEDAVRKSEQRYRELLDSVTNYIYTVRVENGKPVGTTHGPGCAAVTGYTSEELSTDPFLWYRMVLDADKQIVLDQAARVLAGERPSAIEHRVVHKNGNIVWIRNTIVPRFDNQGRLTAYDGLISDITERRRSDEFVRNILESVDEGFLVISRDYTVISANKAFCAQIGKPVEAIIGRKCHDVSHGLLQPCYEQGEDCAVRQTFGTGAPQTVIHTHRDRDGNPVFVETKSYPLKDERGNITAAIEIVNNITERRTLEDQLRHAQKMEAVGLLAGGIAHDFNNVLTAIIGYGNLLERKLPEDDLLRSYVGQILASSARAAALTQGLLTFSRRQISNPRYLDMNEIITRIEKLLFRLIGEDVDLRTNISTGCFTILADSSQIEQVLMNLATNARDAMPTGGTLTISTGTERIDDTFRRTHGFGKEGVYAAITMSDTGIGMDEKTRQRIFEPFFSTKETGKGTGLGLSIVYGIMKQHNGYVVADSEPGKGSTFTLLFPLTEAPMEREKLVENFEVRGGSETVLVAEDDEQLRKLTASILREFGYVVIEAVDGEDAVRKFLVNRNAVQLILLDAIMPKKSGREAYEEIVAMNPSVKTLFCSGYDVDIIRSKGLLVEGIPVLLKPTAPTQLLLSVRKVLDAHAPSSAGQAEEREPPGGRHV